LKSFLKWLKISSIAILIVFGAIIAVVGNNDKNLIVMAVGIALFGVGLYLLFSIIGEIKFISRTQGHREEKEQAENANCFVYDEVKRKISFEYIENPPDCVAEKFSQLNDMFYPVEKKNGEYVPLKIDEPTGSVITPRAWAGLSGQPVIDYLNYVYDRPQKIAIGVLALIIVGELIGLIAKGG